MTPLIPSPSLLPSVEVLCLLVNDQDVLLPPNALHPEIQQYLFGCVLPSGYATKTGALRIPVFLKNYARPRFPLLIPMDVQLKILRQYQKESKDRKEPMDLSGSGTTAAPKLSISRTRSDGNLQSGLEEGPSQGESTLNGEVATEGSNRASKTPPSFKLSPQKKQHSRPKPHPKSSDYDQEGGEPPLFYEPHGKWAHMKGRTFKSLNTVQHLSGGANCEVFYEKAETEDGQMHGLINKRWDVWRDWEGFYSEIFLYASSAHLRQFQGIYVPHIIGVHVSAQGFVDVMMETPHNSTRWTEAHPSTTPIHVKDKIIRAYEAIHAKGVMHFDTELRHILITEQEEICLIDWQLARSLYPNEHVDLKRCNQWQLEGEMRRVKYLIDYQGARAKEILLWVNGDEAKYYSNKRLRERRALGENYIGQLSDEQWDDVTRSWTRVDPREPSWFNEIDTKVSGRVFEVPAVTKNVPSVAQDVEMEDIQPECAPMRRKPQRKVPGPRERSKAMPEQNYSISTGPPALPKRLTRSSSRAAASTSEIVSLPASIPSVPPKRPKRQLPPPVTSRVLRSSNRAKVVAQPTPPPVCDARTNDKPRTTTKRKNTKSTEEPPVNKRRKTHRENA